MDLLDHEDISIVVACHQTLGNLVKAAEHQCQFVLNCGLIAGLRKTLDHQVPKVRENTCLMLSNIIVGNQAQIQQYINTGIVD